MKELLDAMTYESLKYNRNITSDNSTISVEFYKDTPFSAIVRFYKAILDFLIRKNLHKKYKVYSSVILEDDSVLVRVSEI